MFAAGSKVSAIAQARHVTASRSHTSPLQAARVVMLAAADEVTRQRCMRIIEAASAGTSLLLQDLKDIASMVALTRDLFGIHDLSAVNAALAALGRAAVKALDASSLKFAGFNAAACAAAGNDWACIKTAGFTTADVKAAGCDIASAKAAGYDVLSLIEGFGYDSAAASGCDLSSFVSFKDQEKDISSCILVSCTAASLHAPTRVLVNSPTPSLLSQLLFSATAPIST